MKKYNFLRFQAGVREILFHNRWKNFFIIAYLVGACFLWMNRNRLLFSLDHESFIYCIMSWTIAILLLAVFALGFVGIIILCGTPIKAHKVEESLSGMGFTNAYKEPPVLLSIYRDKFPTSKGRIYVFEMNNIPFSHWIDKQADIGQVMGRYVAKAELSKNGRQISLNTLDIRTKLPEKIAWWDEFLPTDNFVLALGESLTGRVSVNLVKTPHVLLGGSSGSGKTILFKLLLMQAVRKGAEVYIADFKNGVDFSPIWRENCKMCFDVTGLVEMLSSFSEELERRKALFQENGFSNLDSYNENSHEKLPRMIFACDELADMWYEVQKKSEEKEEINGRRKETKSSFLKQIESSLEHIARQGRAFGIHLVLATQRPDANVLPGQIKNNIDFCVCGRANHVLSQIILDSTAAADEIPKDAQGRFITNEGVVFQSYWFDKKEAFKN